MQDPAVTKLMDVLTDDMRTRHSGGIERFLVSITTEAGQKAFREWSAEPVTRLFLDALKSMSETSVNQYPDTDRGLAVAFGCQSGLSMAARLIEDPTRVFPSVFDGVHNLLNRKPANTVGQGYVTPPDGASGGDKETKEDGRN